MAGPQSNGYWAMWIFMLVLSVALATIIASYFYLSNGPEGWPPRTPDITTATWASLAALLLGGATFWLGRSMRRGSTGHWRVGAAASIASATTLGWLSMRAWNEMGLTPVESAYGSIVVVTIGFNWMLIVMLLIMLVFTMAWAVLRPKDIRGHGLAWLTELQGYYTAASWLVTFAVLYLTPYAW
jgi:cytochrome c oxidase subunit 1/cytochrome c oxidase subunit I+III